jgi:murein DD-endopeptidase MepM/ murein hydrolase activator NlpD
MPEINKPPVSWWWNIEASAEPPNRVIVQHDDGDVSCYYHLLQGSLEVGKDDIVNTGDLIAKLGNSGGTGSSEPHLHIGYLKLRDTGHRTLYPMQFQNLKTNVSKKQVTGLPGSGFYTSQSWQQQ